MLRYTIGIEECPCQINDFSPRQYITRRGLSETSATTVASRFSLSACLINHQDLWLQLRRPYVPAIQKSPVPYRQALHIFRNFIKIYDQTVSQFTNSNGNAACTEVITALNHRRNSMVAEQTLDLRSVGGLPFWTSAPQESSESTVCSLDEPVAPPQPSRPVRPPSNTIRSPADGRHDVQYHAEQRQ